MALCLLPIMTLMWLFTTACIMASVSNLTLLAGLVNESCVTSTDPIFSQAITKGPFADKDVIRPLREIISSEVGANDGFGFPFLMLAVYLIRHADIPGAAGAAAEAVHHNLVRSKELYIVLLSVVYGAVVGYGACKAIRFALKRKWIDNEPYALFPAALGLFIVGTCGAISTDDLLACFVAGNRGATDEVNSCIDSLFHGPEGTGLTLGRLFLLGFLALVFRRIPAILMPYKLMPAVCTNYKEALFMGYFGPTGAGAVVYFEHTRHQFPELGEGDEEETNLVTLIGPVVYFFVILSIVVHGLSIPALSIIYSYMNVKPIQEDGVEIRRVSMQAPRPVNAAQTGDKTFIAFNRFSRPVMQSFDLPRDEPMGVSDSKSNDSRFSHEPDELETEKRERRRTIRYIV
ncbi:Sodium/hydrogen exchanger family protein [Ilyonectria destructans]|nr:Sodium/hydrogen exchanger family protein [Ilyonectria destructans]